MLTEAALSLVVAGCLVPWATVAEGPCSSLSWDVMELMSGFSRLKKEGIGGYRGYIGSVGGIRAYRVGVHEEGGMRKGGEEEEG